MPDSTAPLIALVPSPLLGPRAWADVATVLVPHSNAGVFVPAAAAVPPVTGCVFVDAREHATSAHAWPTAVLDGHHLHMLVDPDAVAAAVLRLELQVSPK